MSEKAKKTLLEKKQRGSIETRSSSTQFLKTNRKVLADTSTKSRGASEDIALVKKKVNTFKKVRPSIDNKRSSVDNKRTSVDNRNINKKKKSISYVVLEEPVKSQSDKKKYKVIRLENGITCCLISDLPSENDPNDEWEDILSDEADSSDSEENDSDEDPNEKNPDFTENTDATHDRKFKTNPEQKLAAAALCVGCGSLNDPLDIPGMAHFLEHMVFMGSKKYPKENDFDKFIKKSGGEDNASTDCETTTFYFEIFEKYLTKALDKFVQFFIAPLMRKESMLKEREAIDGEFNEAKPKDEYREEQLLFTMFKDDAKINSFMWGNLKTLLYTEMPDDVLHKRLHEFRKTFYTSDQMTLAIQARLPMETILEMVLTYLGKIPATTQPKEIHYKKFGVNVFDEKKFCKMYYVKPIRDIFEVIITWKLPSQRKLYKSKPHHFIGTLLGDESPGSLISYFKKEGWALALSAGVDDAGSTENSLYSLFQISIVLTRQGLDQHLVIIYLVYQYIAMVKNIGIPKRYYEEMKEIQDITFRFQEECPAADNVEEIAENLHYYPSRELLRGPVLYYEFNETDVIAVLKELHSKNMNVMVFTSLLPEKLKFDKVEPWFDISYTTREYPKKDLELWSKPEVNSNFNAPKPNSFITRDFTLMPTIAGHDVNAAGPRRIPVHEHFCELWYKRDYKFNLPIAYYYVHLVSSRFFETPEASAMSDMYVKLVDIIMAEEGYPAAVAQLNYNITTDDVGVEIKVSGFNQKLPELLLMIAKYLRRTSELATEELFDVIKYKVLISYYNKFIKIGQLARDLRLKLLVGRHHTLVQKHEAAVMITYLKFKEFVNTILNQVYVQMLVEGNVTESTAIDTANEFYDELKYEPLARAPWMQVYQLPLGENCLRVKSLNLNDGNSVVTNYYQLGPYTYHLSVTLELLMLIIDEPLFDTLRTKQGLGYQVYCTFRDTFGILGYTITVMSQEHKHTVDKVEECIEDFRNEVGSILSKMSQKKFKQYVADLIKVKKVVDTHLQQEVDRHWEEIIKQECAFDRNEMEIKTLEEITLSGLRRFWDRHNSTSSKGNFHKLSVQVVGEQNPSKSGRLFPDLNVKSHIKSLYVSESTAESFSGSYTPQLYKIDLIGSKEDTWAEGKAESYFITNVEIFVSMLPFFANNVFFRQ